MQTSRNKRSRCARREAARAFTLVETVVVVALSTFIMLALTFLIRYFYVTNAYTLEQSQALSSARRSVETAVRDLRGASYGADGSYPLEAAATSSVTFFANINTDPAIEKVRYYLSSATLYRGVTEPAGSPPSYAGQPEETTLVIDHVRNDASVPLFTYYDASGTPLTEPIAPAQVASVRITAETDVNPNRAPDIYTLVGSATLRNLLGL